MLLITQTQTRNKETDKTSMSGTGSSPAVLTSETISKIKEDLLGFDKKKLGKKIQNY